MKTTYYNINMSENYCDNALIQSARYNIVSPQNVVIHKSVRMDSSGFASTKMNKKNNKSSHNE